MKQIGLNSQSLTDWMFKIRELTPGVKGPPPCEDSQPMLRTGSSEAVQLAHKGSPNLTAATGGFILTGQDDLTCFPANTEYYLQATAQPDIKNAHFFMYV